MSAKKTFEQDLKALEKTVEKLEGGSLSLDESIRLFQKGRELGKNCETRLAEAELKIRELVEDESGQVRAEDFDESVEEK